MVLLEKLILFSIYESLKVRGQLALLNNPAFRAKLKQLLPRFPGMEEGEDNDALLFFQTMDSQDNNNDTSDESTAAADVSRQDWMSSFLKDPRSFLTPSVDLLSWSQASGSKLERVERLIMSRIGRQNTGRFVPVHTSYRRPDPFTRELLLQFELHKIWTVTLPHTRPGGLPKATPLVMLHGFGVGSAFFCMNLENLAIGRTVYALDLPGFGRSSRPEFPTDPVKIELAFVAMLDQWRQAMHLDSFILLGHSFGGFIACSYAASFPERVEHLILADPWGFDAHPDGINWNKPIPTWIKTHYDWEWIHAGGFLRACGPIGPLAVQGFSHYICKRFYRFLGGDSWAAADYVYQCNALDNKHTEDAIVHLSKKILWARNPSARKLAQLPIDFFVSFIYGEESWLDSSAAESFQNCRLRGTADLHLIPGVGHDSYAEDPPAFNQVVNGICSWVDSRRNVIAAVPNNNLVSRALVDLNMPGPSRR